MTECNIKTHAEEKVRDNVFRSLTSKQWQIYYYLMSISKYNSKGVEDHRFIYKNTLSYSGIAAALGISRPTVYSAMEKLKEVRLITETQDYYLLMWGQSFTDINSNLLKNLTNWGVAKNRKNSAIDLLRIYLFLKRLDDLADMPSDRSFTKRELIQILGHNTKRPENYEDVTYYLALLSMYKLIDLKFHTAYDPVYGKYTVYHLQSVYDNTDCEDLITDISAEMLTEGIMSEDMKTKLMALEGELLDS